MNGFLSPNLKVWNETQIFLEFDLNEYSELATLLTDRKDFCGDRSHMCHLSTVAGERVEDTRAINSGSRA